MLAEVASNSQARAQFAFHLAQVVFPLGLMLEVEGPLPQAVSLTDDDLLLHRGFLAGVAPFEVKGQADGMGGGVQHVEPVLQRKSLPFELRLVHAVAGSRKLCADSFR